jgi:ABC-2 type transport system ATP-binding protein
VLPESTGFPRRQTGLEYLRYHARLFGHSRVSARLHAVALLAEVGLSETGSSPLAHYSRGMRQRLGIARALINDPEVVFFDEPTLGLDPAGQRQVLRLVERVAHERTATVILSTHLLGEVEDTCSRVLILDRGRKIADGTVAAVTRQAAAPRRGRFRVPAELRERALAALTHVPGIAAGQPAEGRSDWLVVAFADLRGPSLAQASLGGAVDALTAAGIPVLAFELDGARLSDAFLSLTEARR